ncbi:hypothetical protein PanWU01x14_183850 [Parasponia andersonii]|uniref:Uncharacterized protein n=1 Tax=Parasponia andersonii TaxID=3476 RepID=A0A2P5C4R6_PARAD|nr:hypothetical protein PanWU01x14_183850 [Parasponia andersonii]
MDCHFVSPGLDERPLASPSMKEDPPVEQNQGPRPEFVNDQRSESELLLAEKKLKYHITCSTIM